MKQNISKLKTFIQQNNKQHLVFDMDGTLLKLHIDWADWHPMMYDICAKYEPDFDFPRQKMWKPLNRFIKKYGQKIREELHAAHGQFEQENLTGFTPNQALIDFAKSFNGGKYLYTSNSKKTAQKVLGELDLLDLWDVIVTRDDVDCIKPDPEGMRYIYQAGQDKGSYLMLGDSSADSGVAQNFKIDFWQIEMDV